MSRTSSDRLSIYRISNFWAAETNQAGIVPEDIAEDLIDAALHGEFQYSPKGDWRSSIPGEPLDKLLPIKEHQTSESPQTGAKCANWSSAIFPPTGAPTNYDPRLGMLIECFDRDGNAINSSQLQKYLDARKSAPGAIDRVTRQLVAHEVFLSVEGLRLWCDRPEFAEWAKLRGLSRPCFIELTTGDGTGQTSAVVEAPEEADAPSPTDEDSQPDDEASESRREKQAQKTNKKHKRWYDLAQEIMAEGKKIHPTVIAREIAKRERGSKERGVNAKNIKRRLDEHYPGWAERGRAQNK